MLVKENGADTYAYGKGEKVTLVRTYKTHSCSKDFEALFQALNGLRPEKTYYAVVSGFQYIGITPDQVHLIERDQGCRVWLNITDERHRSVLYIGYEYKGVRAIRDFTVLLKDGHATKEEWMEYLEAQLQEAEAEVPA